MIRYKVVDISVSGRRIALLDDAGSYHVAVIGSQTQEIGALIEGPSPRPGYSVLRSSLSGAIVRVIFMATDCTQEAVLERLHPKPAWREAWQLRARSDNMASGRLNC